MNAGIWKTGRCEMMNSKTVQRCTPSPPRAFPSMRFICQDRQPFRGQLTRVILASVLGASVACFGAEQAKDPPPAQLRAGAAAVDITPEGFPMVMVGGWSPVPARGAHDPLHARALVLKDGDLTIAITVVDCLGMPQEVADEAKTLASEQCGIPRDKMLLCATHTHSGPPIRSEPGADPAGVYREQFIAGIAEAIVRARAALRPAAAGHAAHPLADEVFNRRWFLKPGKMPLNPFGELDQVKMNPGTSADVLDRPAGPTDPDITILSLQGTDRRPLALLASYSLHYVGHTPEGLMSADYFGEFARLMPSRLRASKDFVAMMANGTSGDINNIPFLVNRPPREPFEQVRIVARKAADAAWFAFNTIGHHRTNIHLGMVERRITLKRRKPTAEQIAWARGVLATTDEAERSKLPRHAETYARRFLGLADAGNTMTVPLQALRIGDLAICAIPFEALVEIGLDLKHRSPFGRTMVIGLANGSNGYLPTPEQHALGGYETWLGTNRVQKDASVIITRNLLEMLGTLAREG